MFGMVLNKPLIILQNNPINHSLAFLFLVDFMLKKVCQENINSFLSYGNSWLKSLQRFDEGSS